jgi:hypothetical protein
VRSGRVLRAQTFQISCLAGLISISAIVGTELAQPRSAVPRGADRGLVTCSSQVSPGPSIASRVLAAESHETGHAPHLGVLLLLGLAGCAASRRRARSGDAAGMRRAGGVWRATGVLRARGRRRILASRLEAPLVRRAALGRLRHEHRRVVRPRPRGRKKLIRE